MADTRSPRTSHFSPKWISLGMIFNWSPTAKPKDVHAQIPTFRQSSAFIFQEKGNERTTRSMENVSCSNRDLIGRFNTAIKHAWAWSLDTRTNACALKSAFSTAYYSPELYNRSLRVGGLIVISALVPKIYQQSTEFIDWRHWIWER